MIYLVFYILITVFSVMFIHDLGQRWPVSLTLMLSTFYATIFFNLINLRRLRKTYIAMLKQKRLYGLLMVSILVIWAGSFSGAAFISPTFSLFVVFGIGAAFGSFFAYWENRTKLNLFRLALIVSVVVIFYTSLVEHYSTLQLISIIVLTLVVGAFDYIYGYASYKISQHNLDATQILAARFWLMLLAISLICWQNKSLEVLKEHYSEILVESLLLSIAAFIVPVYLYQKSVLKIGPNLAMVLCGFIPLLSYLAECAFISLPITTSTMGTMSILLSVAIGIPYVLRRFQYAE